MSSVWWYLDGLHRIKSEMEETEHLRKALQIGSQLGGEMAEKNLLRSFIFKTVALY